MSDWQVRKLKEVCEQITVGFVGTMAEHYRETGVLFLRSLNIKPFQLNFDDIRYIDESFHQKIKKSSLRPGDVAVVRTGYPGTACVIPKSLPVSNCSDLVIVRPGSDLNPHYLAAIFNSAFGRELVAGNLVGAAQQHFNVTVAKELKLLMPPRKEQDKIAAILSAYDDLIANNQRRITLLEHMAEDIYREWFVRLRFPGHEQAKIQKGAPEGWTQRRFGEFCVLKRGYDLPDSSIEPGPYPVIASTSIKAHHKFFKALPPVITTGRSGSLGDVLYVNAKAWPLNTALYVKDFCGNSPFLIFYTLKNMGLETFNAGAGVPSLNRNHLNGISIAVPPTVIQAAFDAKLSPIFQLKEGLEKQLELLKTTRDALLPRLISGRLAVDALDIRFPPNMAPPLDIQ